VGGKPFSVVVGYFTASGNQDILVGTSTDTVSLLLGNGDGTFQSPIPISTGGDGGLDVSAAPFVAGGNYNIVVANNSTNTISVLLGNGNGTFQPPVIYPVGVQPYTVAVGDVNNDGFADIVVANQDPNGGTVSVLLNDGTNNFPTRVDYPAGTTPSDVVLGNFRGTNDPRLDIAVSNSPIFGGGVSVLLNQGEGTFAPLTSYPTGAYAAGVAIADYNGDGFPDIVVANAFSNSLSVLRNDGMPVPPPPGGAAPADLGKPVLVLSAAPPPATVVPLWTALSMPDHRPDEGGLVFRPSSLTHPAADLILAFDFVTEDSTRGQ
jgi:hypothetical protein